MMNGQRLLVVVLILFAWISTSRAAVLPPTPLTVCPIEKGSPCYHIRGEITHEDFVRIKAIADQALKVETRIRPLFYLDSEGGDVDAAISIGREFRRISAVVSVENRCLSACVFLLAGAVQRIIPSDSKIGIHRPYSLRTDERNYDAIQKEQDRVRLQAKLFLENMNLPSALYDAMLLVPANEIMILSEAELAQYGLSQDDPVKQEMDDAKQARHYGISKQELFMRKAQAKSRCGSLYSEGKYREFYLCWDEVLRNPKDAQVQ